VIPRRLSHQRISDSSALAGHQRSASSVLGKPVVLGDALGNAIVVISSDRLPPSFFVISSSSASALAIGDAHNCTLLSSSESLAISDPPTKQ
jgi:hypothetical protein